MINLGGYMQKNQKTKITVKAFYDGELDATEVSLLKRSIRHRNLLLSTTASLIIRWNIKIVICRLDCAGDDYDEQIGKYGQC